MEEEGITNIHGEGDESSSMSGPKPRTEDMWEHWEMLPSPDKRMLESH